MSKLQKSKFLIPAALCVVAVAGLVYYCLFSSFSKEKETKYVYIDRDDNIDSVYTKLTPLANKHPLSTYKTLTRHSKYADNIKTGRYAIEPGDGALTVFRHLKNGLQKPINLTVPSVRTMERLAAELSKHLMVDSAEIIQPLQDNKTCQQYGFDTTTIACLFIPNTYDIYWNTSVKSLLDRMKKENDRFWDTDRTEKAKALGMTKNEVITLASIIDEETANNAEKPKIAGMYYNRLRLQNAEFPQGMPLQADPTVKFAMKRFDLRRIYTYMLNTDSPYNTYKNAGLPPGPIRIPSVAGIDAVLNMEKHDFLYMCAKEDFSGTHNFAHTYQEHLKNAAKYSKALNERGIK